MKVYNDLVAASTTSTSLDKDTWNIYEVRNSSQAGITAAEEDKAPYFLVKRKHNTKIKKIFLWSNKNKNIVKYLNLS